MYKIDLRLAPGFWRQPRLLPKASGEMLRRREPEFGRDFRDILFATRQQILGAMNPALHQKGMRRQACHLTKTGQDGIWRKMRFPDQP